MVGTHHLSECVNVCVRNVIYQPPWEKYLLLLLCFIGDALVSNSSSEVCVLMFPLVLQTEIVTVPCACFPQQDTLKTGENCTHTRKHTHSAAVLS